MPPFDEKSGRVGEVFEQMFGHRGRKGGRPGKEEATWGALLSERVGITDDCAGNWMKMAAAVEALAARQQEDIRELLTKLPWDWTPEESAALEAAVTRLTEGKTQRQLLQADFLADLGLAPRDNPRNAAGNNQHGKTPMPPATPAALREALEGTARQAVFGTTVAHRVVPGSPAWFMEQFAETYAEHLKSPEIPVCGPAALENLPLAERKHFYETVVKPFASAWRKFAGL
jgi:hypothetical protein